MITLKMQIKFHKVCAIDVVRAEYYLRGFNRIIGKKRKRKAFTISLRGKRIAVICTEVLNLTSFNKSKGNKKYLRHVEVKKLAFGNTVSVKRNCTLKSGH